MGWITRRIAGSVTFVIVTAILGAYAAFRGWISGNPTLSTATGAVILGIAFLVSLGVTSSMKRTDEIRKAWEANQRAWQEYYARSYPGLQLFCRRRPGLHRGLPLRRRLRTRGPPGIRCAADVRFALQPRPEDGRCADRVPRTPLWQETVVDDRGREADESHTPAA